jgi:CRISPR-associated protein Csm4
MKFTVVKLKPKGAFHIGERENWREGSKTYIPSDTLFSALCHCYMLLYGEADSLLKGFLEGNPPFLISSAFPYWKDKYFFPVPKNQFPKEKKAKKIQFVDLIGMQELLSGERLEDIIDRINTIPSYTQKEEPWKLEDVPRIGLSRWTNHPGDRFFHFGQVIYHEGTGLFLLMDFRDNHIKKRILASLNLLAHEGIGGDRTCGKGLFEKPEILEFEMNIISGADGLYSTSIYCPLLEELTDIDKGFYELEDRKGYIYSPSGQSLRRRSIRAFSEGSVFSNDINRLGRLVDVTPDIFKAHRVYRYGFIFPLPCKREVV